jgi:hypothetical protein|tara:strand:+ start:319 stop:549 length:231 start_codon:yes stop_codon:yes gene_type:complete
MNTDLISDTLRSVGTIIVVTLIGSVLGLLFGCVLGLLQIGIGLGLINGAIMGFIAGLITVIASAWLRVRRNAAESG